MSEPEQVAWRAAAEAAYAADQAAWGAEQAATEASWGAGGLTGIVADRVEAEAMEALFAADLAAQVAWRAWKGDEPSALAKAHGWSADEVEAQLQAARDAWHANVSVALEVERAEKARLAKVKP